MQSRIVRLVHFAHDRPRRSGSRISYAPNRVPCDRFMRAPLIAAAGSRRARAYARTSQRDNLRKRPINVDTRNRKSIPPESWSLAQRTDVVPRYRVEPVADEFQLTNVRRLVFRA